MKELCEARAKLEMSSNFQIYPIGGKSDPPLPPPIQNCQRTEWTLHFSMWPMRAHLKQLKFSDVPLGVNLTLPSLPPFKTARGQSELFAFQCDQWEPIWNSSNFQIYPWGVNLTLPSPLPPPIWNCQRTEWTLCFPMWPMRAHLKQLKFSDVPLGVNLTLPSLPPFKTARGQMMNSSLFNVTNESPFETVN